MSTLNRRAFLGRLGSVAIVLPELRAPSIRGGPQPSPPSASVQEAASATSYDLLIAGGRVVDPSQKLSGERDVAISNGRIARIAANIPRNQARHVFEARGKIVTPGLIDLHAHVYKSGIPISSDSDRVGIQSGVTTVVDCGSTGANTFLGFRKYVIDGAATRIYALLNISTIGLVVANEIYLDPAMIDPKAAIRVIEANRDVIMGLKVRVRGKHTDVAHDLGVLKTARQVADVTGLPIMLHWTNERELLNLLKRGDILTHPFNPPSPNSANLFGTEGAQADKVLPQILELKARGIWTDGQAATTHHQWEISEKAAKQGWFPDVISTDLAQHVSTPPDAPLNYRPDSIYRPGAVGVPLPMSHFLHLGLSLDQVIERVTTTPAKVFNYPEDIGTLKPGVTADVSIFDLTQGNFEFRDGPGQTRTGRQQFVPFATVKGGIFLKTPAT